MATSSSSTPAPEGAVMPVPGSTFTPISTARSRSHTVGSNSSPSASRHDIDPHNRPRIDSARGSRTQIPPSPHPERCPSVRRTRHRQIIPGGGVPSRAHDETNSRPRVMTFSLSCWGDRINELRHHSNAVGRHVRRNAAAITSAGRTRRCTAMRPGCNWVNF